jgi:hypothetical protein
MTVAQISVFCQSAHARFEPAAELETHFGLVDIN